MSNTNVEPPRAASRAGSNRRLGHDARLALVLSTAALAGACTPPPAPPRTTDLEIAIGPDGARVVATDRAHEAPRVQGEGLAWELRSIDGVLVAHGETSDPRFVTFEDLLAPEGRAAITPAPSGVVRVRVPRVDGILTLRGPDGETLGRIEVGASATAVSRLALLAGGDVLGPPVQVGGRGGARALDLLFLPEGYASRDLPRFRRSVDAVVAELRAHPDLGLFWDRLRVWRREVRSRESGLGERGVPRQTAFDVAYGVGGLDRCAFFATAEGRAAAERLRQESGAEAVVILANGSRYGGCARDGVTVNVVTSPAETALVVTHELGHALFGLADEYDWPHPEIDCRAPFTAVNVTSSLSAIPWADMLTTRVLPTPNVPASQGTVGAFEGAGYCATGRFRPTHDCLMRNVQARLCPVCMREVGRRFATGGSDGRSDAGTDVPMRDAGTAPSSDAGGAVPSIRVAVREGDRIRAEWLRVAGASSYWAYVVAMRSETTPAGHVVSTVPDARSGTTVSARFEVPAVCANAGRGRFGLVVQVMVAERPETTQSAWAQRVGELVCP